MSSCLRTVSQELTDNRHIMEIVDGSVEHILLKGVPFARLPARDSVCSRVSYRQQQ